MITTQRFKCATCNYSALFYPVDIDILGVAQFKLSNKMVSNPKYVLKKSTNNQFYWVLNAANGEVILKSSETYVYKQGCQTSIASSRTCVADSNFKRLKAINGQFYFTQIANNGLTLGISEMYINAQGCENGIASVKKNAPIANYEDTTI